MKKARKKPSDDAFDVEAFFADIRLDLARDVFTQRMDRVQRRVADLLLSAQMESPTAKAEKRRRDAAVDLYRIFMMVGNAVAQVASEHPDVLRGVGRRHHSTFVPYDGDKRCADVEGWLKLIELGAHYNRTTHKERGNKNAVIAGVVDAALNDLHDWRDVRGLGEGLGKPFNDANSLKAFLALPMRRHDPEGYNGEKESEYSLGKREAYHREHRLTEAAKRLPDLKSAGRSMDIWETAVLEWLSVRYGDGDKWQLDKFFDGITKSRDRCGALATLVKSRFHAIVRK